MNPHQLPHLDLDAALGQSATVLLVMLAAVGVAALMVVAIEWIDDLKHGAGKRR